MNVLVLASWYPAAGAALPPDPTTTLEGIFVRAQVEALASFAPESNFDVVHVGSIGINRHELAGVPGALARAARGARIRTTQLGPRVHEHRARVLVPPPWLGARAQALPFASFAAAQVARLILAGRRPDILHAHVSFPAGWAGLLLRSWLGVPLVLTEHMGPFPFESLRHKGRPTRAVDHAIRGADAVIAVSAALARSIAEQCETSARVIPNVVDEELFTAAPECRKAGPVRLVAIGRLVQQKGFDVLLRALAMLRSPAELALVGDGPELASLVGLAQELGLGGRVRFEGARAAHGVAEALRQADVCVLPSRSFESFGLIAAEALTAGLPVVATRTGGPEAIVTAADGILVAPDDPVALAGAIDTVIERRADYRAADLRARAIPRFGRTAVAREIFAVYEEVLRRPPRRMPSSSTS